VLIFYLLHNLIFYSYINPLRYGKLVIFFYLSYIALNLFRANLLRAYVSIMFYFVLISASFYIWQLLSSSSLVSIAKTLVSVAPQLFIANATSINLIVHNVEIVETFRNSGSAWEPGGFAT